MDITTDKISYYKKYIKYKTKYLDLKLFIEQKGGYNGFQAIECCNQNTMGDSGLCGLYAMMNAIIFSNIEKHGLITYDVLADCKYIKKLIPLFKKCVYDLAIKLIRSANQVERDFGYTLIIQPNGTQLKSYNEMYELNNVPLHIYPFVQDELEGLDLTLWNTNCIVVQVDFDEDVFCNNTFTKPYNIEIMKNFFESHNFVLTFVIGNYGHWKCYGISKNNGDRDDIKYVYLDSLGMGPGLGNKIAQLFKLNSYEEFIHELNKCAQ